MSRIKKRFDVREIKSSKDITDWNAGKIPVEVIHPASAGHGLKLQAGGSTLIWFGLTWSLELYQQTNARLWRQGQASGTVVIEHIITKRKYKSMALQQELIQKANSKEDYDEIADEIFRLRELRQKTTVDTAARDEQIKRINDLQD